MQFPIYKVNSKVNYGGSALIAAESAAIANKFIEQFQEVDKENVQDSQGYLRVTENDKVDYAFGTIQGILDYGIYYVG